MHFFDILKRLIICDNLFFFKETYNLIRSEQLCNRKSSDINFTLALIETIFSTLFETYDTIMS